jgi:putative peptide zinc metalloprotease protein
VLGSRGGGPVAVDPADAEGTRTLDRVFQVELGLPVATARLGSRAYVRFDHGTEPLGAQWYRRLRQLLLSRFNA